LATKPHSWFRKTVTHFRLAKSQQNQQNHNNNNEKQQNQHYHNKPTKSQQNHHAVLNTGLMESPPLKLGGKDPIDFTFAF